MLLAVPNIFTCWE